MAALTTVDSAIQTICGAPASDRTDELVRWQVPLQRQLHGCSSKDELLQLIASHVHQFARPVAMIHWQPSSEGPSHEPQRLDSAKDDDGAARIARQLVTICQAALQRRDVEIRRQAVPAIVSIAVPVAAAGSPPAALAAAFACEGPPTSLVLLLQIAANLISLWKCTDSLRASALQARHSAELVELLEHLTSSVDFHQSCSLLVDELQTHLSVNRVILGWRAGQGTCRVAAVSGLPRFDPRSAAVVAMDAALDEAVVHGAVTVWPTPDENGRSALAHKKLCAVEDLHAVWSMPLRDIHDQTRGALLLMDESAARLVAAESFVRAAERPIASTLAVVQQADGGWLGRWRRAAGRRWRAGSGKLMILLTTISLAALAIPLPYRIRCDCQIEPVVRRFVVAPFDGTLAESCVKPGDIVARGAVLAKMDGRELRWQRAGVAADQKQALKKRDAAQAAHNYSEAQIAQLDAERLDVELQLLDHRMANLEIRSPLDGIVTGGDLERAEGAPLTTGQSLFEIAPLDRMVVEVSVPDDEVAHVAPAQRLLVSLDAYPGQEWQLQVDRLQPRAEIRENKNVFLVEGELDNDAGQLRPGMKGRARIVTATRSLGWILLHKPWEYLSKTVRW